MGVDLVICALLKIIKKIPGISLDIIGMGAGENDLKNLTRRLKLTKQVRFYSWMSDRKSFEDKLSTAAIGLALFNTKILDDKIKNADPGKIKDYMLCGLPVITTNALATYKDVEKAEAGIVIDYNENEFINAVCTILSNKKTLETYRKNAHKFVRQFDWGVLLDKQFKRLLVSDTLTTKPSSIFLKQGLFS
jgi:glycosyltransferase involved in cell wall biosynthesis